MEIIKTTRGSEKLCHSGYAYTKRRVTKSNIHWDCSQRTGFECPGAIITNMDMNKILSARTHSHDPDNDKIEAMKARAAIKDLAIASINRSVKEIVAETMAVKPDKVRAALGDMESIARAIRRERQQSLCKRIQRIETLSTPQAKDQENVHDHEEARQTDSSTCPFKDLEPSEKYDVAKGLCESLTLLASQAPQVQFLHRCSILKDLQSAWMDGCDVQLTRLECELDETIESNMKAVNPLKAESTEQEVIVKMKRGRKLSEPMTRQMELRRSWRHSGKENAIDTVVVGDDFPGFSASDVVLPTKLEPADDNYESIPVDSVDDAMTDIDTNDWSTNDLAVTEDHISDTEKIIAKNELSQEKTSDTTYNTTFKCSLCDEVFKKSGSLERHRRQKHLPFKCSQCNKCVSSELRLRRHERAHSKTYISEEVRKERFECELCHRTLCDRRSLAGHMRSHKGERPYVCSACGRAFGAPHTLRLHMRLHSGIRPHKCPICDKTFVQTASLLRHKRMHTGERPWSCELCNMQLCDQSSLIRHRDRIHPGVYHKSFRGPRRQTSDNEKIFVCPICTKSMKHQRSLDEHLTKHSGIRPYKCADCPRAFHDNRSLRKHALRHAGIRDYVCSICGSAFTLASSLRSHMRTHSDARPFPCESCGVTFKTRGALLIHTRLHTGERPFGCETCGQFFRDQAAMIRHSYGHTGYRPHACGECGKGFRDTSSLANHMRVHTGDKPFACSICPTKFAAKSTLKKHVRCMHTCTVCSEKLPTDALKEHKLRHVSEHASQLHEAHEIIDDHVPGGGAKRNSVMEFVDQKEINETQRLDSRRLSSSAVDILKRNTRAQEDVDAEEEEEGYMGEMDVSADEIQEYGVGHDMTPLLAVNERKVELNSSLKATNHRII